MGSTLHSYLCGDLMTGWGKDRSLDPTNAKYIEDATEKLQKLTLCKCVYNECNNRG